MEGFRVLGFRVYAKDPWHSATCKRLGVGGEAADSEFLELGLAAFSVAILELAVLQVERQIAPEGWLLRHRV